jgi:hypothetical protein
VARRSQGQTIANEVVFPLLDSRASWERQGEAPCSELRDEMQAMFRFGPYKGFGARVTS